MKNYELKHKGTFIFEGTENECYYKLQRVQSQSADWAMKYEGYTITEKEVPTIESLTDAYELAGNHQVTAQELINDRLYIDGRGWSSIHKSEAFQTELAELLANKLGGRKKDFLKRVIYFHKPQHWGFERFVIEKYGEKPPRLVYIAGQDQVWEMNAIRQSLYK